MSDADASTCGTARSIPRMQARQLAAQIRKWPIGLPIPEAPGPNPPPPLKRPAVPKRPK